MVAIRRGPGVSVRRQISVNEAVAIAWGIAVYDLIGYPAKRAFATPRAACYRILREQGYSLEKIGYLTKRDHSTVLHGVRRSEEHMQDPVWRANYERARNLYLNGVPAGASAAPSPREAVAHTTRAEGR